ncbi:MAG: hypothetical protein ABSF95_03920 [Verrucomicrobiota bacterium]|jgi:hypothetical protein
MDDTQQVLHELFSNPTALLYIALGMLALFLGLLIFDPFRSRKRHRHRRRFEPPPPTFRQRLVKPFAQIRAVWRALFDLARRRARRRARAERLAEQMRRSSK